MLPFNVNTHAGKLDTIRKYDDGRPRYYQIVLAVGKNIEDEPFEVRYCVRLSVCPPARRPPFLLCVRLILPPVSVCVTKRVALAGR